MKQLTDQEGINKWKSLVRQVTKIPEEHLDKISLFAHWYALAESDKMMSMASNAYPHNSAVNLSNHNPYPPTASLLPMNLSVISKIKDLSKVEFVSTPKHLKKWKEKEAIGDTIHVREKEKVIEADTFQFKFAIHKHDLISQEVKTAEYENLMVDEVVRKMNELIDNGMTLYVYQPISDVFVMTTGPSDSIEIGCRTRMKALSQVDENGITMNDI